MVASSSESGIDRLNLTEPAGKVPFSFDSGGSPRASPNFPTTDRRASASLPTSPRAREAGLVVRLFPTPPQIFGISHGHGQQQQQQHLERDNVRPAEGGGDSAEAPAAEENELLPLEAKALKVSRMLKSLQPRDPFPGFPVTALEEPESPKAIQGRHAAEAAQILGLDKIGASEDEKLPLGGVSRISVKERSDSFNSTGFPTARAPSPKSRRRMYGMSSRGGTPSTSIGSASDLQFPAVEPQSPPSPEPLGAPRPGSPIKWRSRASSISPVEELPDPGPEPKEKDTPVQGLVVDRDPSFAEYSGGGGGGGGRTGKVLFEDFSKHMEGMEGMEVRPVEPEPAEVVQKMKAAFLDDRVSGTTLFPGVSTLETNGAKHRFTLDYPSSPEGPKAKPLRGSGESRETPQPSVRTSASASYGDKASSSSSRGRSSVSFINPFPAWFNGDSRDKERNKRKVLPPSVPLKGGDSGAVPASPSSSSGSRAVRVAAPDDAAGIEMVASPAPDEAVSAPREREDEVEVPVSTTSSPGRAGPSRESARTSEGTSEEDSSDVASKIESPAVYRPFPPSRSCRSYVSDDVAVKSDPVSRYDSSSEEARRPRSVSLPASQVMGIQASASQRRKGECHLCHRGSRLTEKESCLVCNAKYCANCVLAAMESMPEGRKCKTCIGKPVSEAKRSGIGKSSRLLNRLLSPQEVQQILKAEKECAANQLRPEQLFVNEKQLTAEELSLLLKCENPPQKLKPGRYWYDTQSGLWGKMGERPDKLITPAMKVGGPLQEYASNGTTQVYMNGRQLGKLELKFLKLAGVHCPPTTHLWVEPNGSYLEEGQNNAKGNIWNKTSIKLLFPFFSLPTPGASSARYIQRDSLRDSPDVYMPDFALQNKVHKILVLGHEGSGRSTLFKQTKFLFKDGFTREERLRMKTVILQHIYRYIGILLEGRERFEEEEDDLAGNSNGVVTGDFSAETSVDRQKGYALDARLKQQADWFLEMLAEGSLDVLMATNGSEYALLLHELWRDVAIQATHKRKDELNTLPDAAEYFLEKVVEISGNDYEPSDEDILRAEGLAQGSGLAEVEFSLDGNSMPSYQEQDMPLPCRYQLIKVGGKGMADGYKWLDMFEEVHAVVFCVAISEYDQVATDSDGITRSKLRQKELFESVLNHPILNEKPMVLLLNKYDLFEKKICKGVPLVSCEWFSDFRPVGASQMTSQMQAQQGYTYIVHKYKEFFASTGHKLFTFKLNALERDKVQEAFHYVREILNWKDSGWDLCPEESNYSTDLSSYSVPNFSSARRDGYFNDRSFVRPFS